jgi:hypothetical protein
MSDGRGTTNTRQKRVTGQLSLVVKGTNQRIVDYRFVGREDVLCVFLDAKGCEYLPHQVESAGPKTRERAIATPLW